MAVPSRLDGRVVIVTRDANGIGDASAVAMGAAGATVVRAAADDDPATVVTDAAADHGAVHGLHLTVTTAAERWCDEAAGAIGRAGGGAIVTTVTTRALAGDVGHLDEAIAGGGVVALTLGTATIHGKRGVRANCISVPPADIDQESLAGSTLLPWAVEGADVAGLAVFLLSDDSSFVTGQVIRCDGGLLAHLPHYASLVASGATTAGGRR